MGERCVFILPGRAGVRRSRGKGQLGLDSKGQEARVPGAGREGTWGGLQGGLREDGGWAGLGHHHEATTEAGRRKSRPEPGGMGAEEQTEGRDR